MLEKYFGKKYPKWKVDEGAEFLKKRGEISEQNQQWLTMCGLTLEQMKNQVEPEYAPVRKLHLYHCDHRGLPLALIDINGHIAWSAESDEWGNVLREDNPNNLQQLIRLPGQQYDGESGLHYNRYRYFDPLQGRYITQDPIGLTGGWNLYSHPLNPVLRIDPLGLSGWNSIGDGGLGPYCQNIDSAVRFLPQEDVEQVIHNAEIMHNVYNPPGEYVLGVATVPAIVGMAAYGSTASIAERSAACIESAAKSVITQKERDSKKLMLTCTKSFMNKGASKFQGKVSDFLVDTLSSYSQK
ncbi:RHS repeat protein [Salmonella enterica]|nr:RHS repeat protein [Salmonella enterica]